MNWGNQLYEEMGVAVLRFGFLAACAGFALGCIVGIAVGWLLFGGGA